EAVGVLLGVRCLHESVRHLEGADPEGCEQQGGQRSYSSSSSPTSVPCSRTSASSAWSLGTVRGVRSASSSRFEAERCCSATSASLASSKGDVLISPWCPSLERRNSQGLTQGVVVTCTPRPCASWNAAVSASRPCRRPARCSAPF